MNDPKHQSGVPPYEGQVRELLKQLLETLKEWRPQDLSPVTKQLETLNAAITEIAKNTAHLATLTQTLTQLSAGVPAVLTATQNFGVKLTTELGGIGGAIQGKGTYNKPTYKRTLRKGESLATLTVPGLQDPNLRQARATLVKSVAAEVDALLAARGGKTLEESLAKTVGAKEALDAVKAAFIDRPNLDQTTRLLLTTKDVVDLAFIKIVDAGTPSFWDTQATVEAIRVQLQTRAEALFGELVKGYAKERGWAPEAAKSIKDTLIKRYTNLS